MILKFRKTEKNQPDIYVLKIRIVFLVEMLSSAIDFDTFSNFPYVWSCLGVIFFTFLIWIQGWILFSLGLALGGILNTLVKVEKRPI